MKKIRRLLVIAPESRYGRRVLAGIHAYCRLHGAWEYHLESDLLPDMVGRSRFAIREWKPDGIIALVTGRPIERLIRQSGLPAVNVGGYFASAVPTVFADNDAIGRLAARHFLDNGCRNFAFCATTSEPAPRQRCAGFVDELQRAGFGCRVLTDQFIGNRETNWVANRRQMDRWLRGLPKPVAILCSHDKRGQEVSWACRRAGLRVPDDVALVAVGDDDVLCQMSSPPLSSVDTDAQRIGYEAARLLDRFMRTGKPPARRVEVPPRRLVARRSSDLIAIDDPEIASTIRFIRDHAHEPTTVKDLLCEVPISRRAMERRFVRAIGRTPKAEIMRIRIHCADELLRETDLSVSAIALRAGFSGADKFCAAYRRCSGLSPLQYRRRHRLDASTG